MHSLHEEDPAVRTSLLNSTEYGEPAYARYSVSLQVLKSGPGPPISGLVARLYIAHNNTNVGAPSRMLLKICLCGFPGAVVIP